MVERLAPQVLDNLVELVALLDQVQALRTEEMAAAAVDADPDLPLLASVALAAQAARLSVRELRLLVMPASMAKAVRLVALEELVEERLLFSPKRQLLFLFRLLELRELTPEAQLEMALLLLLSFKVKLSVALAAAAELEAAAAVVQVERFMFSVRL